MTHPPLLPPIKSLFPASLSLPRSVARGWATAVHRLPPLLKNETRRGRTHSCTCPYTAQCLAFSQFSIHTHTHTHIYIYTYIFFMNGKQEMGGRETEENLVCKMAGGSANTLGTCGSPKLLFFKSSFLKFLFSLLFKCVCIFSALD